MELNENKEDEMGRICRMCGEKIFGICHGKDLLGG
jgi:hypothetical protein